MAGELVKWMGGKLVKPSSALQRCRKAREAALAVLRLQERAIIPAKSVSVSSRPYPGLVVDLPRICAVHDRPYVARYVMDGDGHFHHAQTIEVTRALWRGQYEGNENRWRVNSSDIEDESCAWCGAHGRGALLCPVCTAEICRGRTADRYFRCRASCGYEASLVTAKARMHEGFRPEICEGM